MNWKPAKDKPICPQICEHICLKIASGEYTIGEKLPSVRELALKIGVNPNTVQRSYEILEEQGIIFTERNSGRFVSENVKIAEEIIADLKTRKTEEYFTAMNDLGLTIADIKNYVKEWNE